MGTSINLIFEVPISCNCWYTQELGFPTCDRHETQILNY